MLQNSYGSCLQQLDDAWCRRSTMAQIDCCAMTFVKSTAADLNLPLPALFGIVSTYYHMSYMYTSAKQNESRQATDTMHTTRLCYTGIWGSDGCIDAKAEQAAMTKTNSREHRGCYGSSITTKPYGSLDKPSSLTSMCFKLSAPTLLLNYLLIVQSRA